MAEEEEETRSRDREEKEKGKREKGKRKGLWMPKDLLWISLLQGQEDVGQGELLLVKLPGDLGKEGARERVFGVGDGLEQRF